MSNLFKWLIDRIRERKSKQMIGLFLGTLVLIGILPEGTDQRVIDLVETGQGIYHEGVDSVATTIETGTDLYNDGRGAVLRTIDTGSYFWAKILAYLLAIGSFIGGLFTKDAKAGEEYELRAARMKAQMIADGVSPPAADRYLSL